MDRGSSEEGASGRLTSLRLALVAIPLSLLMAACGGTSARHALVYEKPVTSLPSWGWIWRAAPDGSNPQRLVRGYEPSVSPDGRWIVYLHKGEQQIGQTTKSRQSLWLISSGGGKPRQLGRASEWIEVLQWSPDSKRFLVLSAPGLEVVDRASGAIRLLSVTTRRIGIGTASFSPDGRAVAYDRFAAGGSDIYVISSGPRALAAASAIPSCSFSRSWPMNSPSRRGRKERSSSSSLSSVARRRTRRGRAGGDRHSDTSSRAVAGENCLQNTTFSQNKCKGNPTPRRRPLVRSWCAKGRGPFVPYSRHSLL